MTKNLSVVDMGNYELKAIFESEIGERRLQIPNVVAVMEKERDMVEAETDPLNGLHVEITSRALSKGKGYFAVGNLASKLQNNDELTADSKKGESDQPIILLLTAVAIDAVKNAKVPNSDVIQVKYSLSTGLPIDEAKKKGSRKALREKLQGSEHTVVFLDTPEYGGRTVRIEFEDVLVSSEGQAATIELTTNADGSLKNEELAKMTYLVHDIGGLSTDTAVIEPNGEVDNVNSMGEKLGVSIYLDLIIQEVKSEYSYKFRSRKELEEIIISDSPEIKGHIYVDGDRKNIQPIIDKHLKAIAAEEYKILSNIWNNVPSARRAYLIGGGSIILEKYIKALNEEKRNFPLHFFDAKTSVWMIVQSYMKILKFYLAQKTV